MQEFIYRYRIVDIQDGSTFFGWIDKGFDERVRKKVRLVNIKCYSTKVEPGKDSKKFVEALLKDKEIYIKTIKDRFRRWSTILAIMWFFDRDKQKYVNVNDLLVEKEFAENIGDDVGNRVEETV
jgi:hypothetical protein